MLSNLKFRSKKGISLAVSLVICLFLIMVTGGITTVAMLQHNETGSNMNSRQAYISAKSGLDTFYDALKNNAVTGLPATSGDSEYYVLYYNSSNELKFRVAGSEEDARDLVKELAKDDTLTIVGGEGTYFKVVNKNNKYKVTALNVTGKYNGNVSMNRGDLSFDAIIMTKYTFGLKSVATTPTGPSTATMTAPTRPTATEDEGEERTLPPPPAPAAPNGLGGSFLMIGQQTCLNEQKGDGGSVSSGTLLKQYFKGGDGGNNFIAYAPSVENAKFGYTYFPIVYDRFVKVETNANRTTVNAINEGIYLLGAASAYKDVDEFYNQNDHPGRSTLGTVSYITQNASYEMNFNCKFLCIKNNFVSIGADSKVNYCGSEGRGYVVVYLPKEVTFFLLNTDKNCVRSFTKPAGYYMLKNNSYICDPASWNDPLLPGEPEYDHYADFNLYDTIMSYYGEVDGVAGEIHSGCHEDANIENPVAIVNNSGHFNTDEGTATGFTKSANFTYNNARDRQSIFLAPNTGVTETGNYHWYCGRSFNFQWFNYDNFVVNTDCHIEISSPTVVLTIGPLVYRENGQPVTGISNYIEGKKSSSLTLYGNKGTGAPGKLNVMCAFNVKYIDSNGKERTYPVVPGTYTNVPTGLNILSEAGERYFLYDAIAYDLEDASIVVKQPTVVPNSNASAGRSVAAQSVSVQTNAISNLFSKLAQKLAVSPLSIVRDNGSHEYTLSGTIGSGVTGNVIEVEEGITKLYYTDNNTDSNHNIHTLSIGGAKATIRKGIGSGTYEDYIVFMPGVYNIPAEGESKIDLYDVETLIDRSKDVSGGSNFELKKTETDEVKMVGKYY